MPASTRLSARSCRTNRNRDAPSASRTPSSRRRAAARASARFARFALATSSTSATITMIARSGREKRRLSRDAPVAAGVSVNGPFKY